MKAALILVAFALCAVAQNSAEAGARLEGQVLADANGLPLRRVQVILTPLAAGKPAIGTQTNDRGRFVLRDIEPGGYELSARRDGYLTSTVFTSGARRMPPRFNLQRGDAFTDLTFRLRPWAVISGEIRYEDGDPAVGVPIDLYRRYNLRGRHGYARVAAGTTNDHGEYRIHGLAPGAYFVAVNIQGDQTGPGVEDQPRIDNFGREIAVPSYTTTFFPNSTKLSEASPVRLREGDDLTGIDIYLRPIERVKLSGRITDGIAGTTLTGAALTMERMDSGDGALQVPINLTFDREQRFHIDNVAPGSYQLWVDTTFENQRLLGRSLLTVTNDNIEDLELVAVPARQWGGEVTGFPKSAGSANTEPHVVLEPRSERGAVIVPQIRNGKFDLSIAPFETYDVFISNLPDNLYISAIRAGGADVRAAGLTAAMASNLPFQIVLDPQGGSIAGAVTGADLNPQSDAARPGSTVVLIPEPPRDRLQDYRETFADQYGEFHLNGIAPGRYILAAWLDEPTCDVYDQDALDPCRATGTVVDVAKNSHQEMILKMKPLPSR